MLETLEHPVDGLIEIKRTLKAGGVLGVACVEYGGLVLGGPNEDLLRRFYSIRERLWQLRDAADPYRGRQLRGLLERAGFLGVTAMSKYFSYGTGEAVKSFGRARAERMLRRSVRALRDGPWSRLRERPRCDEPGLARVVGVTGRICRLRLVSSRWVEAELRDPPGSSPSRRTSGSTRPRFRIAMWGGYSTESARWSSEVVAGALAVRSHERLPRRAVPLPSLTLIHSAQSKQQQK